MERRPVLTEHLLYSALDFPHTEVAEITTDSLAHKYVFFFLAYVMIFLKLCQYSCQEILHKSLPFWHTLSLPQSPVLHSVPYAEVKFQKSFDFTFSQLGFFLSSVFCYFFSYTQIASLITCLALVGSRDNLATAGHSRHTQALNQHLYNEDSQVGVSFVPLTTLIQ